MSIEDSIYQALAPLVGERVFRDVAQQPPARPYITFQQVGGPAINFLEGAHPGKRFGRFQVNVWADDRDTAAGIARQAEQTLAGSQVLRAFVEGAQVASFEPDTSLFGTRQDFTFFF